LPDAHQSAPHLFAELLLSDSSRVPAEIFHEDLAYLFDFINILSPAVNHFQKSQKDPYTVGVDLKFRYVSSIFEQSFVIEYLRPLQGEGCPFHPLNRYYLFLSLRGQLLYTVN
jgi:hypothetical protein